MRRALLIGSAIVAALVLLVVAQGAREDGGGEASDGYYVRAIFDNGGFIVPDEEVRVAGAKVGVVSDVDITNETEAVHADGSPSPGKAVIVMRIENPAFQDFRADASCLIRPQSFIGEKFVECDPTRPRSADSEPPPELEQIGEDEPGEGQYLLPIEQNGKAVDLDLVNNIMRESYADRFRLILNDLGAGFASRGDELSETIRRSSPALRQTNEVLAILAAQNDTLAQLAEDSDASLGPLEQEKESLTGFIRNAQQSAAAAAERREDIEAGLVRLPPALDEVTLTMRRLENFSDEAQPTLEDFAAAAPSLVRTSQALGPFSDAARPAISSLGDAADGTVGPLNAADPVIRDLRDLAEDTRRPAGDLRSLLSSLDRRNGFAQTGIQNLMALIYNGAGASNVYDEQGHFTRAILQITNCTTYTQAPTTGCNFGAFGSNGAAAASSPLDEAESSSADAIGSLLEDLGAGALGFETEPEEDELDPVEPEVEPEVEPVEPEAETPEGSDSATTASATSARSAAVLMDYLMGSQG